MRIKNRVFHLSVVFFSIRKSLFVCQPYVKMCFCGKHDQKEVSLLLGRGTTSEIICVLFFVAIRKKLVFHPYVTRRDKSFIKLTTALCSHHNQWIPITHQKKTMLLYLDQPLLLSKPLILFRINPRKENNGYHLMIMYIVPLIHYAETNMIIR